MVPSGPYKPISIINAAGLHGNISQHPSLSAYYAGNITDSLVYSQVVITKCLPAFAGLSSL